MSPIPGIIASSQTANIVTGSFYNIATVTGTGSSGTVSFTSIPSGYKALQIRYIGKSDKTGAAAKYQLQITFNGDTATNYANHVLYGTPTTVAAAGNTSAQSIYAQNSVIPNSASAYANMHTVGIIDIIDYTSTTKAKTLRAFQGSDFNNTTDGIIDLMSGLYFATPAAITSISLIINNASNWTTTSVFALYGVK